MNKKAKYAFTLIEVIMALAIVGFALLALIRLHLIALNAVEHAEMYNRATILAQQKISEILANDWPDIEIENGSQNFGPKDFFWKTEVSRANLAKLNQKDFNELRQLRVDVTWKKGSKKEKVTLTTLVANRNS